MSVRSSVETITVAKARKILENNRNNRPISDSYVAQLAQAINDGEWQVNGESIKIDVNNDLKDGQHRLNAIIIANKPIETMVIRNLPSDCFDTIDRGKKRTMSDILSRHGEVNATVVAGGVSWVWRYEQDRMRSTQGKIKTPRPPQAIDCLERNPGLRDSASAINPLRKLMPPSIAAFCHYLFSKQNKALAETFFEKLSSGEGLRTTQAVYRLRERLIENRGSKAKLPPIEILALTFKAWNHARNGDTVKTLRWRTEGNAPEDFPVIE